MLISTFLATVYQVVSKSEAFAYCIFSISGSSRSYRTGVSPAHRIGRASQTVHSLWSESNCNPCRIARLERSTHPPNHLCSFVAPESATTGRTVADSPHSFRAGDSGGAVSDDRSQMLRVCFLGSLPSMGNNRIGPGMTAFRRTRTKRLVW